MKLLLVSISPSLSVSKIVRENLNINTLQVLVKDKVDKWIQIYIYPSASEASMEVENSTMPLIPLIKMYPTILSSFFYI